MHALGLRLLPHLSLPRALGFGEALIWAKLRLLKQAKISPKTFPDNTDSRKKFGFC